MLRSTLKLTDGYPDVSPHLNGDVKTLQRELQRWGYAVKPDGRFGPSTQVRREVVDAPGPVRSRGGAVSAQIRRDDAIFVGDAGEGIDHALPALSQIVQRDQRRTLAEAVDRELDGGRERWHCAALLITTVIDLYR
jgi:hypothetical protein